MVELPPEGIVGLVLGGGGALVLAVFWIWQFLTNRLHSDKEMQAVRAEGERAVGVAVARGDEWKALYEAEVSSHQKTRDALAVSNERNESQAELVRVTARMFEQVQRSMPDPPRQALGSGS